MKYVILFLYCGLFIKCTDPVVIVPVAKENEAIKQAKAYTNPALINGSSFGHYFQSLYRLGLYNDLLLFTECGSVQRFGKNLILSFYQSKLRFDFELGKLTNVYRKGDTLELTYSKAQIDATRRLIRLQVLVENDTCKLVLHNLNANPFF